MDLGFLLFTCQMWRNCLEQGLANSCHSPRCNWEPFCIQNWVQDIWRMQDMGGISLCEDKPMTLDKQDTLEELPLILICINLPDQEESCELEFL